MINVTQEPKHVKVFVQFRHDRNDWKETHTGPASIGFDTMGQNTSLHKDCLIDSPDVCFEH